MISRIGIPEQSMTKTVLVHVFLAQENCLRMVLSVDSRARNRICICDLETGPWKPVVAVTYARSKFSRSCKASSPSFVTFHPLILLHFHFHMYGSSHIWSKIVLSRLPDKKNSIRRPIYFCLFHRGAGCPIAPVPADANVAGAAFAPYHLRHWDEAIAIPTDCHFKRLVIDDYDAIYSRNNLPVVSRYCTRVAELADPLWSAFSVLLLSVGGRTKKARGKFHTKTEKARSSSVMWPVYIDDTISCYDGL